MIDTYVKMDEKELAYKFAQNKSNYSMVEDLRKPDGKGWELLKMAVLPDSQVFFLWMRDKPSEAPVVATVTPKRTSPKKKPTARKRKR